jgi:hypothetical protein
MERLALRAQGEALPADIDEFMAFARSFRPAEIYDAQARFNP